MRLFRYFVLLFLSLIFVSGCSSSSSSKHYGVETYDTALDFKVVDQKGETVSLSDFKGKKVYINVWASWCGPCMKEIPELNKLYKKNSDVVFLSITSPSDSKYNNERAYDGRVKTINKVVADQGIEYPVYFDKNDSFMGQYTNVQAYPTHIMINSDGTISSIIFGSGTEESIQKMIDDAT